jgi:hypothetical protein
MLLESKAAKDLLVPLKAFSLKLAGTLSLNMLAPAPVARFPTSIVVPSLNLSLGVMLSLTRISNDTTLLSFPNALSFVKSSTD